MSIFKLVNQNDTTGPIVIGTGNKKKVVTVQTNHTNFPAGASVQLEGTMGTYDTEDFAWLQITMTDPTSATLALVQTLAAADKAGYADVSVFKRVRVRRTDANGGNAYVDVDIKDAA